MHEISPLVKKTRRSMSSVPQR